MVQVFSRRLRMLVFSPYSYLGSLIFEFVLIILPQNCLRTHSHLFAEAHGSTNSKIDQRWSKQNAMRVVVHGA